MEGPTDDPEVTVLRDRQRRNFLATLLLSQGVPMLSGGDEIGRTQGGNNNAYCQDNEISWYDWANVDEELLAFTRRLIEFRRDHPVFRRRGWFHGRPIHGSEVADIAWFTLEGERMAEEHWGEDYAKSLAVFLNGATIPNPNARAEPVSDDDFLLLFNAHHEPLPFVLPAAEWGESWLMEIDTDDGFVEGEVLVAAGETVTVEGRSMVVLRRVA